MNGDGLDAMEPILEADSFCIDPSCLTFFDFIMNNISGSSRPHDIIVPLPKGVGLFPNTITSSCYPHFFQKR